MTSAPTSAKAKGIARPRPRLPPVTTERFPSRRNRSSTPMIFHSLFGFAWSHEGLLLDRSESESAHQITLQACKDDRDRNASEERRRHDVVPLNRISAADQGENLEG